MLSLLGGFFLFFYFSLLNLVTVFFFSAAPPGNPEIWWMKPEKGSVVGGEEIGLIGKKFQKGIKLFLHDIN